MDRRLAIASAGGSPLLALRPLGWWRAESAYVVLSAGNVSQWNDISGNGNHLTQATPGAQPQWNTTDWGSGKSSVLFTGSNSLAATSGTAISSFNGSDAPMSLLVTMTVTVVGDNAIVSWDNTTPGNANMVCRLDNVASNNVSRFTRTDDSGSSSTVSDPLTFGFTHVRLGYVFPGTTLSLFVNGTKELGGWPMDVGTVTFNRIRMGDGPGATDSLMARVAEVMLFNRALSDAEVAYYYSVSLSEWQ